jgi:hypothetical protein
MFWSRRQKLNEFAAFYLRVVQYFGGGVQLQLTRFTTVTEHGRFLSSAGRD